MLVVRNWPTYVDWNANLNRHTLTLFSPFHFEKSQVGIPLRKMKIRNYLWFHRVERFFQCCNLICEPGLEAFWLCHFEFCLEVLQVSPQAWYVVKDPDMFVTRWDQTLALVIKQQTWMKWNLTSSLAKIFIDKYRYICNRRRESGNGSGSFQWFPFTKARSSNNNPATDRL